MSFSCSRSEAHSSQMDDQCPSTDFFHSLSICVSDGGSITLITSRGSDSNQRFENEYFRFETEYGLGSSVWRLQRA
jgi:hypothetical protein